MAFLVIREKEDTKNVKLEENQELTLGRSPACDVSFGGNITVSNRHCMIYYNPDKKSFVLRDLKSLNGTILNLNRISADIILADGDKIKIGDIRVMYKESNYNPSTKTRKILKIAKENQNNDYKVTATCVIPNLSNIKRKPEVQIFGNVSYNPGDCIGKYQIVKRLGNSRYGAVFFVKALEGGPQRYALKIYNKAFDVHHPAIDEFNNTMSKIIQQQENPYLLGVVDSGIAQGHCYFVMKYVPEGNLNDIIATSAPFSEFDSLSITYTIGAALRDAYAAGHVVHGELCPDNVLIDSQYNILVRSYGMNSWVMKHISEGTPSALPWYISPEQITSAGEDWYSDLYSLGIIFFQLLTGYLPFQGDKQEAVYGMHLNKKLPAPLKYNPNISVSEASIEILKTMTKKSPGKRFASWDEFLEKMEEASLPFEMEDEEEAVPVVEPPRQENIDKGLAKTFNNFFNE
jgi:pSer/pThr/pTyr-binding forkhead associated (FHA) protein